MNQNRNKKIGMVAALSIFVGIFCVAIIGTITTVMRTVKNNSYNSSYSDDIYESVDYTQNNNAKTLDQLYENLPVHLTTKSEDDLVKGSVNLAGPNLYDELPDIDKYPMKVQGNGSINYEIWSSGEKAGDGNYAWLTDMCQKFNRSNIDYNGQSVSLTLRSVPSGIMADYILSGKAVPDLCTPSNELFPNNVLDNGGYLELVMEKTVGNIPGIIIKNDLSKEYNDVDKVLNGVISGKLNIGYTNANTSATGANLLLNILNYYGNGDIDSQSAKDNFKNFNKNIPFICDTTQQMVQAANSGTLDGMVMEYQDYHNDELLSSSYKFLPFGLRHDNPLYKTSNCTGAKDDALSLVTDFLSSDEAQELAKRYGFNGEFDDFQSQYDISRGDMMTALKLYKQLKDGGQQIISVFVADCSGSMRGLKIAKLQESLINGSAYINENYYIGLISYSLDVTVELPIKEFDLTHRSHFIGAVENLYADGSTSSYEALIVAEKMIEEALIKWPDAKPMIFLLSDGAASGSYTLDDIGAALQLANIPICTIAYDPDNYSKDELQRISNVNEAAAIVADEDDVVYQIKTLFNSKL